jgi:hypothetical protein
METSVERSRRRALAVFELSLLLLGEFLDALGRALVIVPRTGIRGVWAWFGLRLRLPGLTAAQPRPDALQEIPHNRGAEI